MLRSVVVCPDQDLSQKFAQVLEQTTAVENRKTLNTYPIPQNLLRTVRAQGADIVFLSFENLDKASEIVVLLDAEARHVEVVAMHREMDPEILRLTMRLGIREFLAEPFEAEAFAESLEQIRGFVGKRLKSDLRTTDVFSFLPSKAGVGASTVALNTAAAMARDENTRVLLGDFDLNSGMTKFLLKLVNQYSVLDALDNAARMDEHLWADLVTTVDGDGGSLDVLHSGPVNPNFRIDIDVIRELAAFMGRWYGAVCFDLSGNLERYSLELMSESKRIVLVCTPEIASLHLAREKIAFLQKMDLSQRVSIVLNRMSKNSLFTPPEVEEMLGMPVMHSFNNHYVGVNAATQEGKWLAPASEMGQSFDKFGRALRERPLVETAPRSRHKFLEYLAPARRTLYTE